jgi:hypothetical protein
MPITCPACGSAISLDDVNVSTDVALCRACGRTCEFSQVVGSSGAKRVDVAAPPAGAWFETLPDGFRLGASTRSWMALFMIPFMCVWSAGSFGGIFAHQVRTGNFDLGSSIFALPFLIGGCIFWSLCAMSVAGKVELVLHGDELSVFTGVGPVGWTRRFVWSEFSSVREDSGRGGFNLNGRGQKIALEGKRRASFGAMLSEDRRYFLLGVLRQMLWSSKAPLRR